MKDLLKGKAVLVAGAGGLIGSQIVVGALSQGARVIAADIDVAKTKQILRRLGVDYERQIVDFFKLDITSESDVRKLFEQCKHIDGAVNSAYPRNKQYGAHFFDVSLESFNENVTLNLGSSFLFTQQCAAYFKIHMHPFSLVNISSVYGTMTPDFSIYENTPMTMPVEYSAIKAGLLNLNRYVAAYVKNTHFRINSVSPGGVFDEQPQSFLDAYSDRTHGAGMLDASDIVGAVLFLLSDQSRYIVGQNITVDDGFSL